MKSATAKKALSESLDGATARLSNAHAGEEGGPRKGKGSGSGKNKKEKTEEEKAMDELKCHVKLLRSKASKATEAGLEMTALKIPHQEALWL